MTGEQMIHSPVMIVVPQVTGQPPEDYRPFRILRFFEKAYKPAVLALGAFVANGIVFAFVGTTTAAENEHE
ncbi:MAG: hypothetical protein ACOCZ9_02425 [Spirochaetota bacterium]